MKKTQTFHGAVHRRQRLELLVAIVILSMVCATIDAILIWINGDFYPPAVVTGFIVGLIILIHEAGDLKTSDALACGICLVSIPLWIGFYLQMFGIWLHIAFSLGLGYSQGVVYRPIVCEYRRIQVSLKSGQPA